MARHAPADHCLVSRRMHAQQAQWVQACDVLPSAADMGALHDRCAWHVRQVRAGVHPGQAPGWAAHGGRGGLEIPLPGTSASTWSLCPWLMSSLTTGCGGLCGPLTLVKPGLFASPAAPPRQPQPGSALCMCACVRAVARDCVNAHERHDRTEGNSQVKA